MQPLDEPRILILGTSYISTEAKKNEVILWSRVNKYLNLDIDSLLVDSHSPFDPRLFIRDCGTIVRMEENIGHPMSGKDGWGRDLCFGINYAAEKSYDWLVFMETDVIMAKPLLPIVKKLCRIGVLAAAPMNFHYQWIETGLMFLSVPYLIQSKFVERYAWHTHVPPFFCEPHVEKMIADELMTLPLRGMRNDEGKLRRDNFNETFPQGCDYLTHCQDMELYKIMLRSNCVDIQ